MKRTVKLILFIAILSFIPVIFGSSAADDGLVPHFLDDNSSRYDAFQARNPDMPFDRVVALVNSSVDKAPYDDVKIVSDPSSIVTLLNKQLSIPRDYVPDDLVSMPRGGQLRTEAADAFTEMREAAGREGLNLVPRSTYRGHGSQVASYNLILHNYNREAADRNVARAGHSEHQLGLAADILHVSGSSGPLVSHRFERTNEFAWLVEHGHEYGFILRYPQNSTAITGIVYEPWHWRYVGVEIAADMRDKGITLFEEYYGRFFAPGVRSKILPQRMVHPSLIISEY